MAAASGGDLAALVEVLDPEVSGGGTPGGVITGGAAPTYGPEKVARRVIGYVGPHTDTTLVSCFVNDQPAVLVTQDGCIIVVLLLNIRDGLVEHMHAVGDPIGLANAPT